MADVCYYIGEDAPVMTGVRNPEIPQGYSYDYINAEVIMSRLSVKDGRFVLPDGMSYKVMVLPPFNTMRPELLQKIEQLILQGGVVLGPKPEKSPSLENFPACDIEVKALADKLWSGEYTDGKMDVNYGSGKIMDGYELSEVLADLALAQDVAVPEDAPVLWTHRSAPGMDIYFISNQSDDQLQLSPVFRTDKNLKPQLWDAVSGEIRALPEYEIAATGIKVPLVLEAAQSWFVVFTKENKQTTQTENFPAIKKVIALDGKYTVDFLNKELGPKDPVVFNELSDWSESDDEQIKYYSGTATYTKTFVLDELEQHQKLYINLGKVSVMAKVKLNGKYLGGLWMAPYRLNITDAVKAGENKLEIEVVNLWRNQLIKDKSRPEREKYTWLVTDDIMPESALQSSGLLGPVKIETISY